MSLLWQSGQPCDSDGMFSYMLGTDYVLLGLVWLHIQDKLAGCLNVCHPVAFVLQQLIPMAVQLNFNAVSRKFLVHDTCYVIS